MKLKNITAQHILKLINNYNYKNKNMRVSHSQQGFWTDSKALEHTCQSIKKATIQSFIYYNREVGKKEFALCFDFIYDKNEKLKHVDVYCNHKYPLSSDPSRHTFYGIKVKSITKGKHQILEALLDRCLYEQKKNDQRHRAREYRERQSKQYLKELSINL